MCIQLHVVMCICTCYAHALIVCGSAFTYAVRSYTHVDPPTISCASEMGAGLGRPGADGGGGEEAVKRSVARRLLFTVGGQRDAGSSVDEVSVQGEYFNY